MATGQILYARDIPAAEEFIKEIPTETDAPASAESTNEVDIEGVRPADPVIGMTAARTTSSTDASR